MDIIDFVDELSKLRSNSTFLAIKGYRSDNDELADYSIVFNMSYSNALKRSIDTLNSMSLSNDLERQARDQLLASYEKPLSNPEKIEDRDEHYSYFMNDDGSYIKGVKLHVASNTLHLYGLLVHKRVHIPGDYKKVNSAPLTIAKKKLSSLCAVSKFRQFKLVPDKVESISVKGLDLLPPEV